MVVFAFIFLFVVFILYRKKLMKEIKIGGKDYFILKEDGFFRYFVMIALGILVLIFFIWNIVLLRRVLTGGRIEEIILSYEQENIEIEKNIITLQSEEKIQEQLAIFGENYQKIQDLKEAQSDFEKAKWLLYFGR